jgi:ribonuclease VapC
VILIDASALIAMIAGEDDADQLADLLAIDRVRCCSPIALWETAVGLCRSYAFTVENAKATVKDFLVAHDIEIATITEREYSLALYAYANYGKGKHPAALNMGDCFAYASAKGHRASLLFKGNDFSKTDVARPGEKHA